jgi:hypothetical protein
MGNALGKAGCAAYVELAVENLLFIPVKPSTGLNSDFAGRMLSPLILIATLANFNLKCEKGRA